MTQTPEIAFRPVTKDDMPMLRRWMDQPHWREWWGDPETELGYIIDMIEGRDTTRPFIFMLDEKETGYIQYWTIADQLFEPWLSKAPWMTEMPEGTIGVDISIGDRSRLSRGIGTAVLSAFVAMLREQGSTHIIIDPDPANKRAVRAYEKAGFRVIPELQGRTGEDLLMRHDTDN